MALELATAGQQPCLSKDLTMRDNQQHPASRRHRRRPVWGLGRTVAVAGLVAVLLGGLAPRPAQAHVPIVLLVLAPKADQTVTADPRSRSTPSGCSAASTRSPTPSPSTSTPSTPPVAVAPTAPVPVRSAPASRPACRCMTSARATIGSPCATRPDRDAPVMSTTVAFTVRPAAAGLPTVPVIVGLGLVLAAATGVTAWWARRRRLVGAAR